MRLGEIKRIVERVLNDKNIMKIKSTQQFGGQAVRVDNYSDVIKAIEVLYDQVWNNTSFDNVKQIIENHGSAAQSELLTAQEYNYLNQYISNLNTKLPLFYGILVTMVKPQDERIINIKLPDIANQTLENLSKTNSELNTLLNTINVEGGYEFKGFDIGTSWYEILIYGYTTYKFLVLAIDLAQRYFGMQEQLYKSRLAKLQYEAAKKEAPTNAQLKEYADTLVELQIGQEVEESISNMDKKLNTQENITRVTKTVKLLIKQMSKGTEFHLSLNPPKGIDETDGRITINYEEIRNLNADDVPQIEHQEEQ